MMLCTAMTARVLLLSIAPRTTIFHTLPKHMWFVFHICTEFERNIQKKVFYTAMYRGSSLYQEIGTDIVVWDNLTLVCIMKHDMWHVICDTWHMTQGAWHLTCDMWHMVGGWTFFQNFSSLALAVWVGNWFEDLEAKDDLLT